MLMRVTRTGMIGTALSSPCRTPSKRGNAILFDTPTSRMRDICMSHSPTEHPKRYHHIHHSATTESRPKLSRCPDRLWPRPQSRTVGSCTDYAFRQSCQAVVHRGVRDGEVSMKECDRIRCECAWPQKVGRQHRTPRMCRRGVLRLRLWRIVCDEGRGTRFHNVSGKLSLWQAFPPAFSRSQSVIIVSSLFAAPPRLLLQHHQHQHQWI